MTAKTPWFTRSGQITPQAGYELNHSINVEEKSYTVFGLKTSLQWYYNTLKLIFIFFKKLLFFDASMYRVRMKVLEYELW